MDDFIVAMSRFRRRKYEECIELCDKMLAKQAQDQSAWLLKCKALTKLQYIDDLEIEEEGVGDILLDENTTAQVARPGTSFQQPLQSRAGNPSKMMRPTSKIGRPITGMLRPGTSFRPVTGQTGKQRLATALKGNKSGAMRPITSGGRYMRLATASLAQSHGQFLNVERLNLKKMAKKSSIAKALCDYLIYVEHNPKKALELSAEATVLSQYQDYWWKQRLGKCYFQLGLIRDAEKQFKSSLKDQEMVKTYLELCKVYTRLDQPKTAIDVFEKALVKYPQEISFLIGLGRIYDLLNDSLEAVKYYKKVLAMDSSNLEAVACIASYHFYIDQPEVALRFYKRLIQLGVNSAEVWNNIGLCCYYDGQYDMFWTCFEKALSLAEEDCLAEIWFNLSHLCIGIGELTLAHQCLKMALQYDQHHPESINNLGVLEAKKKNIDSARYYFSLAAKEGEFMFEPAYNAALVAFKQADYQEASDQIQRSLEYYPEHVESQELQKTILKTLKC